MLDGRIRRKVVGLLIKLAQRPRIIWYSMLSSNAVEGAPKRYQPLQTVGRGRILFGTGVKIGVFPSPMFLSTYAYIEARNDTATISIGSGTWINNNFSAIAEHSSIVIGQDCFIGAGVEILDSDFHGLKVSERKISKFEWAKPVCVGDRVFIGSNVKIFKGVTVGDGSVIANGSLVTRDIPAGVVAGGSPAKVIRELDQGE